MAFMDRSQLGCSVIIRLMISEISCNHNDMVSLNATSVSCLLHT